MTMLRTAPITLPNNPSTILNLVLKVNTNALQNIQQLKEKLTYVKLNMPAIGKAHIIRVLATHNPPHPLNHPTL